MGGIVAKLANELLVIGEEGCDELAAPAAGAGDFLQAGELDELGERSWRVMAEGSDALGDLVDGLFDLVILRLEEGVHRVKVGAGDVPVGVASFRVEHVFVREEPGKKGGDFFAGLVRDADVRFHAYFYFRETSEGIAITAAAPELAGRLGCE